MGHELSLVEEVEAAVRHGTAMHRSEMLRRVTDLFLDGAESYEDEHIAVFDDVMERLVETVERCALIRLARQLAPVDNAPINVVRRLGCSDDIAVACPVIERSNRLTDDILVEIARTKSQAHLAAIAGRSYLSEIVTDSVVARGNLDVTRKVAANAGARFSDTGFQTMAGRGYRDPELAEIIAGRDDLPPETFREMIRLATEIVRQRLAKAANPAIRQRVSDALTSIGEELVHARARTRHHGGSALRKEPDGLKTNLCEQAKAGQRARTIEVLASITEIPVGSVKNLIRQGSEDGVLILCKAAGLGWSDAKNVLAVTTGAVCDPRKTFEKYIGLTSETAQRIVRFIKMRRSASKTEIERMM
jgi:uncharacterized protein (DUF2336 family)